MDVKIKDYLGLNTESVYAGLSEFIKASFDESQVSISGIKVKLLKGSAKTFENYIKAGTSVMEAIIAVSAPDSGITVEEVAAEVPNAVRDARESVKLVYLEAFLSGSINPGSETVNKFIEGMVFKSAGSYAELRSKFSGLPVFFRDLKWIKSVDVAKLPQKLKNRIALGLPGQRILNAISLTEPRADASEAAVKAREWVINMLHKKYYWSLHPATREADLIVRLGSLNKNLEQMMLDLYSQSQLDELAASKIIFQVPKKDPRYTGWKRYVESGVTVEMLKGGEMINLGK